MDSRTPQDEGLPGRPLQPRDAAAVLLAHAVETLTDLAAPDLVESYRALARNGTAITLDQADQLFGERGTTDRLLSLGLAHVLPHTPPVLAATPPVAAVEAALAHKRHELTEQQDALSRAQQEVAGMWRFAETHLNHASAHRLARVLTDPDEISALSNTIGTAATDEHLTVDTFRYELPPTPDSALPPIASSLARGVRHRALYETAFLSHPVGAGILARCAAAGEEIRLLPRLPMKMKITDRAQALLALTATGSSVALHLCSPIAIDALRDYFDLLWEGARPFIQPPSGTLNLNERERQRREVAALMNQGLRDEVIARRMELTARTVRRRISEIMEELGAETRFGAGAEAQRRGWFDAPAS